MWLHNEQTPWNIMPFSHFLEIMPISPSNSTCLIFFSLRCLVYFTYHRVFMVIK
jgi:hypothetical protein